MPQSKQDFNRVLLTAIDGEVDAALEHIGNSMGSSLVEYQSNCLMSAFELLDSAMTKINSFLILNEVPFKRQSLSPNPPIIEGTFTEVNQEREIPTDINLGHLDNCNYSMFATECNCLSLYNEMSKEDSIKRILEMTKNSVLLEQDDTTQPIQENF